MNSVTLLVLLFVTLVSAAKDPFWGCGLLGPLSGIDSKGNVAAPTQHLIDGLKATSSRNKVTYWNWNLAPESTEDGPQYLTPDFEFVPEQWGVAPVDAQYVRVAGRANFSDGDGNRCPATMSDMFMGANEPDITGSCMGSMMGTCTGSCTPAEVASGCPTAHLTGEPNSPLPNGHCDCWSDDHATGCGFWPVPGCDGNQPLPTLFDAPVDKSCVNNIISMWKETAASAVQKGYKYLTAPLIAANMDWMDQWMTAACQNCNSIHCGCPTHVGWHFYATDCRPISTGGYEDFQNKLDATARIMEKFPQVQGAVINEVGMLNCVMDTTSSACIPNDSKQQYPAINQTNHACPANSELPNGFASFVENLLQMVSDAKTSDGRPVVSSFSWFNLNMAGGTYNLRVFNDDGSLNQLGKSYISGCNKWAATRL